MGATRRPEARWLPLRMVAGPKSLCLLFLLSRLLAGAYGLFAQSSVRGWISSVVVICHLPWCYLVSVANGKGGIFLGKGLSL